MPLPTDGLIVVAKRDCPTCTLIEPVYRQLAASGQAVSVYSQDDPSFPPGVKSVRDDRSLEASFHLDIEIVPTVIRMQTGKEVGRTIGWHRGEWEALTGVQRARPRPCPSSGRAVARKASSPACTSACWRASAAF